MNAHRPLIHADTPWQQLLSQAISSPAQLLERLQLSPDLLPAARTGHQLFELRVPEPYLQRIEPGNPHDPLLRQVLPLGEEALAVPGFVTDPLAEAQANKVDGLVHKYQGRVLLILTGACAINCRYCFRRHFPYQDNRLGPEQWQAVLDYLSADSSIEEVIFSGGDPLATPDGRLAKLIGDLEQIPHLKRLRIHTRLPVVIPQRITDQLIEILDNSRLEPVVVLHINHANEVDKLFAQAVDKLRTAKIPVLNQAVLLAGVNDTLADLKALSEATFSAGILPYYLFVLDPVAGAAHFNVSDAEAEQLIQQLQACMPGYLVPKLAREIPGEPSKSWLPVNREQF